MSRKDFGMTLRRLESNLSLNEARALMTFFDDKNTGKISVFDVVKAI
jgi:Ca2+-binding EF-hand superfamily protein